MVCENNQPRFDNRYLFEFCCFISFISPLLLLLIFDIKKNAAKIFHTKGGSGLNDTSYESQSVT